MHKIYQALVERFRKAGIDTPELDARLLIAHVRGEDPSLLLFHKDFPVDEDQLSLLVEQRLAGKPISKIVGMKEFYGLKFRTTEDTLDPRPNSETLIEAARIYLRDSSASFRVLDLGTGTGCLLLSLLSLYPKARGVGIDISPAALKVAEENAVALGISSADLKQSDLFENVEGMFDVLISNPPYIPAANIPNLHPEVRQYDPRAALDGGEDGLDFYRRIAFESPPYLNPFGLIILEIGHDQSGPVQQIFQQQGYRFLSLHQDLARRDRSLVFQKLL